MSKLPTPAIRGMRNNMSQLDLVRMGDNMPLVAAPSCPNFSEINKHILDRTTDIDRTYSTMGSDGIQTGDGVAQNDSALPPEISKLPLSEAKEKLYSFRFAGWLYKKGFKWLKRWKKRYVVLAGRVISYYEKDTDLKPIHTAEITIDTSVVPNVLQQFPYSFSIIPPNRNPMKIWHLQASSEDDRNEWLNALNYIHQLIIRINHPATLRGMGNIYDHFILGDILGKGRYGIVRLGIHKITQQRYAIKIINKNKTGEDDLQHEIHILKTISKRIGSHPSLCQTYEVYEDEFIIQIVMEYLSGGDLFERISKKGKYTEADASHIIQVICSGLQALHSNRILHRDLKPENIMFTSSNSDTSVKISDFGSGMIYGENTEKEIVGTPGYISPEVLQRCTYTPSCDVWSVGVIMFILLMGYPPFYGETQQAIFDSTISGKYAYYPEDWVGISDYAKDLINKILIVDSWRRINLNGILKHPWIKNPPNNTMSCTQKRLEIYNSKKKYNNNNNNYNNNILPAVIEESDFPFTPKMTPAPPGSTLLTNDEVSIIREIGNNHHKGCDDNNPLPRIVSAHSL